MTCWARKSELFLPNYFFDWCFMFFLIVLESNNLIIFIWSKGQLNWASHMQCQQFLLKQLKDFPFCVSSCCNIAKCQEFLDLAFHKFKYFFGFFCRWFTSRSTPWKVLSGKDISSLSWSCPLESIWWTCSLHGMIYAWLETTNFS